MHGLPDIQRSPVPECHRRCLARWLAEWSLDRRLARGGPDVVATDNVRTAAHPVCLVPHTARLNAGQVHLLYPAPGSSAAMRPIYVAILTVRPDASCLVAPFSRFAGPAVPGEWRTGLRVPPLRILCLWNARIVPAAVLRAGWAGRRLTTRHLEQARELHHRISAGDQPNAAIDAGVGPPLRHPLDPRWTYLAEETAAFEESLAAVECLVSSGTITPPVAGHLYDRGSPELPLAAESRAPYGRKRAPGRKDIRT